jgi:hypothetical protein
VIIAPTPPVYYRTKNGRNKNLLRIETYLEILPMNAFIRMASPLWSLRNIFRAKFFKWLKHVFEIDDTRQILSGCLRSLNIASVDKRVLDNIDEIFPYEDVGIPGGGRDTRFRKDIIFITGRFRSGSTLMWNIFRSMPSATAYYEPFNERKWFDKNLRGTRVDSTHREVSNYWAEYDGLEILARWYDEEWTRRQLYMDPACYNPEMQRYIEILVECAKGRPVLQFNRVDFRLPWLKSRFPGAKIIHIFRHPRDQWCSALTGTQKVPRNVKLADFDSFDGFYLKTWGRDLSHYFPFLAVNSESHPYELFYQVWRLSYVFGKKYCDISICFEELLRKPAEIIGKMLESLSFCEVSIENLAALVKQVPTKKWVQYADHEWFSSIEAKVDLALKDYFL